MCAPSLTASKIGAANVAAAKFIANGSLVATDWRKQSE